jgi:hypothetical protein
VTLASLRPVNISSTATAIAAVTTNRRYCARRSSPPDYWARTKAGGPSDRPFLLRDCDDGHGATGGVVPEL